MLNLTRSGQLVDLLIFNYSAMAMHAQAHIHVCMHTYAHNGVKSDSHSNIK